MSYADNRSVKFVGEHPLVAAFLALEVLFLVGGFVVEAFAAEVAPGSTTTYAHLAGILGALGVVFACLGVATGIAYVAIFRIRL